MGIASKQQLCKKIHTGEERRFFETANAPKSESLIIKPHGYLIVVFISIESSEPVQKIN